MSHVLAITLNPALDLSIGLGQLSPGQLHRAEHAETVAAGKGHNVAVVLAGLGHTVTAAGFLGSDNDGSHMRLFDEAGIHDGCTRVSGATRTNVKISETDGRVTDINTPGPTISTTDWQRFVDTLAGQLAAAPAAVVIAGSLPPGLGTEAVAEIVAACRAQAIDVWLDTSGAALAAGITAGVAWAKPNDDELADWAGRPLDDAATRLEAARAMQAAGARNLVVSAGGQGLQALIGECCYTLTPPRVPVVNTVCAGDSLLAGLLHGWLSAWPDAEALRFGCALGAEAVRHVGVGQPAAADFSDLLARVTLNEQEAGQPAPECRA